MGSIKDRNGMDLTEAEDIKKRWQEYWSGFPFPSPGKLDKLNEVRDIVKETGIKAIPMEKKCKKAKWLSEEAL